MPPRAWKLERGGRAAAGRMRNIATMPCRSAQHLNSRGEVVACPAMEARAHTQSQCGFTGTASATPGRPKGVQPRAKELAKSWRKARLTVDFVEYSAMPGESESGGYVLTGRSNATMIGCRCQSWLYRQSFWGGRPLWTIDSSVRLAYAEADAGQPLPAAREAALLRPGTRREHVRWCRNGSTTAHPCRPHSDAALAAMRKPASWLARRAGLSGANRRAHDRRRDGNTR